MKNECSWQLYISSFLDGELKKEEQWSFEQHLEQCQLCKNEIYTMERIDARYDKLLQKISLERAIAGKINIEQIKKVIEGDEYLKCKYEDIVFQKIVRDHCRNKIYFIGKIALAVFSILSIILLCYHTMFKIEVNPGQYILPKDGEENKEFNLVGNIKIECKFVPLGTNKN